jgi:hypothetical protein
MRYRVPGDTIGTTLQENKFRARGFDVGQRLRPGCREFRIARPGG